MIELKGVLRITDADGNATTGTLIGDYTVLRGGISVPDKDVTAGSVALRQHQHEHSGGTGTSGKPVGG